MEMKTVSTPAVVTVKDIVAKYSHVTIQKAKLKKGLYLEVDLVEKIPEGGIRHRHEACSEDAHEDLRRGFNNLGPHVAALTYQYDNNKHLSKDVTCRGFSIKGSPEDDNYGVTLTGLRTLDNGNTITLNTPFLRFSQIDLYGPMDSLLYALSACTDEVKMHLFENKVAIDPQGKLDFNVDKDPAITE